MSGIDELKINAASSDSVDLGSLGSAKKKRIENLAEDRTVIDITSLPSPESTDDIHESPIKDILVGEDSPFEAYKKRKAQEAAEYFAMKEQEKDLEDEEKELEDDDNEISIDATSPVDYSDASSEEPTIEFDSVSNLAEDIIDESSSVRVESEDLSILDDEIESEESDDKMVEEEKPVEKKEEAKVNKIEAPEIDLEITEVASDLSTDDEIIEDDDSANEVDEEETLKILRKLATEKLKPVSKSLDISSFTVLKKPTTNVKMLSKDVVAKAAKWVLPTQESIVLMKEFLGSELEDLRENSEDSSSISSMSKRYKSIYDHIVSAKPGTFDAWLKTTPYADIEHYFFAAYMASFKGANFLPMDCKDPKCGKTFVTDDIPIMNMVKFENEEAKKKFAEIYETEAAPAGKGLYCSEIVPISEKIAIGFREPSIYTLFELASLSTRDREKYSSILEFIPYIDGIYIIDKENATLEPIGYKKYPDNTTKTVRSKIMTMFNALKLLNPDEFTIIRTYVRAITDRTTGISYMYPSVDCPFCGKSTDEIPESSSALLFTRYQLSALVNSSLK